MVTRIDAAGIIAGLVCVAAIVAPWIAAADVVDRPAGAPLAIAMSHIPFGRARLDATAAYSLRHYGERTWQLTPRAIVLHYTCGPSYHSAWYTFAHNRRFHGESPGVCAHYIVDRDGRVHEIVPPTIRCRHTTGLNHVAIAVEFVQPCLRAGAGAVEAQLLARRPQMESGARLVRLLQRRYAISSEQILGHAMANRSALFYDRRGLSNDHGDWRRGAVARFLALLDGLGDEAR